MNTVAQTNMPPFAQSLDGDTGGGHSNGYMSLNKPGERVENQTAGQPDPVYLTPVKWEKGNGSQVPEGAGMGLGNYVHSLPRQSRKMAAAVTLAAHQSISLHATQALSREESILAPLQTMPYNKAAGAGRLPMESQPKSPVERWHREGDGDGMHPFLRSRATIQAAIARAS